MKKIPSIFLRDFTVPGNRLTRETNPETQWVFDGEGVATRKYDGTCVMFDGEHWWARREVKPGKTPPPNFRPVEGDDSTGKEMGWEPIEQSGYVKFLAEALAVLPDPPPSGTYELCGPKIGKNPERLLGHAVIPHATESSAFPNVSFDTYSFEEIRDLTAFLYECGIEGIVWHHPDGRMAKIKARDFR